MPCAVDPYYDDHFELRTVTMVACDLADVLRSGGTLTDLRPETREWIRKHDEEDAQRKGAEREAYERAAERQRILSQMTPEQRRILGLE